MRAGEAWEPEEWSGGAGDELQQYRGSTGEFAADVSHGMHKPVV
jgi:hypothetical protein